MVLLLATSQLSSLPLSQTSQTCSSVRLYCFSGDSAHPVPRVSRQVQRTRDPHSPLEASGVTHMGPSCYRDGGWPREGEATVPSTPQPHHSTKTLDAYCVPATEKNRQPGRNMRARRTASQKPGGENASRSRCDHLGRCLWREDSAGEARGDRGRFQKSTEDGAWLELCGGRWGEADGRFPV